MLQKLLLVGAGGFGRVVQNHAVLGSGVIMSPGTEAHQDCVIGDNVLIYTNSVVRSLARVGDRVWIGSTATVSTWAQVPADTVIPDAGVYPPPGPEAGASL